MAQSTWVALAIVSLFLVYVTARGELPLYLATIIGPYPSGETGAAGGATLGSVTGQIRQGADIIKQGSDLANRYGPGGITSYGGDLGLDAGGYEG